MEAQQATPAGIASDSRGHDGRGRMAEHDRSKEGRRSSKRPKRSRPGCSKRTDGQAAERLIAAFYEHVPPVDVAERSPRDLCGAALSLWRFAERRQPGHAKVRVYNPDLAADGWSSPHTIVEIVNDDMPFLVDSVSRGDQRQRPHGPSRHPPDPDGRTRSRRAALRARRRGNGGVTRILDADRDHARDPIATTSPA